jgi:putative peptidoglycan binding protein/transglycosylase-like protein with SLT domain
MNHSLLRLNDGFDHTSSELRDEAKLLQELLNQHGFSVAADGLFGGDTEMAVKRFQSEHHLIDDGVVGPLTWAALEGQPPPDISGGFATTFPFNDPALSAQLKEMGKYKAFIEEGAKVAAVKASVIAGIGSRESHWGLILKPPGPAGTGDAAARGPRPPFRPASLPPDGRGFGRGLMQIDFDAFEFARGDKWKDPRSNIIFGCQVLTNNLSLIQKRTSLEGQELLRAAVAAYNCGAGNVLNAIRDGRDIDFFTAGRDYSKDVLNRAGWFQRHEGETMIKQISAARYDVSAGELVTITATLLNGVTPELLQVFKDGVELQNLGGATPKYQFKAGAAGHEDVVGFLCSFPGLDPDAEVDTQVQGAPDPGIVLKQGDNKQNMMFDSV